MSFTGVKPGRGMSTPWLLTAGLAHLLLIGALLHSYTPPTPAPQPLPVMVSLFPAAPAERAQAPQSQPSQPKQPSPPAVTKPARQAAPAAQSRPAAARSQPAAQAEPSPSPGADAAPAPAASTLPAAPGNPAAESGPLSAPRFDAAYLHNPKPPYPLLARRRGIEGKVVLKVQVSPAGLAESVVLHSSSGNSSLDAAALETVKNWRFVAAQRGETPVAAAVLVPITFKLEN